MLDLGCDGLNPDTCTPRPASRMRPRIVANRIIFSARVELSFSLVVMVMIRYGVALRRERTVDESEELEGVSTASGNAVCEISAK